MHVLFDEFSDFRAFGPDFLNIYFLGLNMFVMRPKERGQDYMDPYYARPRRMRSDPDFVDTCWLL